MLAALNQRIARDKHSGFRVFVRDQMNSRVMLRKTQATLASSVLCVLHPFFSVKHDADNKSRDEAKEKQRPRNT